MYLKSLTLKGFKSFADKSSLIVEPGITAIVGPNGSGKSNISDAVLWVLGERNAKNLRGQSMEDVIFAGSSARKATSVAEVELVLDNSDNVLPVDFEEVSIVRRMYRSGESEYLINGALARRMDVMDILHDTGLGTGTHSIISQGSIDQILQSKSEDKRMLIEEAAGILKHKQRMARSVRKLERMERHVERIGDVVGEVERQLAPLSRRAKKAQQYEELSEQRNRLRLLLAVDSLRGLQRQHAQVMEQFKSLEHNVDAKKQAIEKIDSEMAALQKRIKEESDGAMKISERQSSMAAMLEKINSTAAIVRDRRRNADMRANEIEVEMETSKTRIGSLQESLAESKASLHTATVAEETARKSVEELEAKHKENESSRAEIDQEVNRLSQEVEACTSEMTRLQEKQASARETMTDGLASIKVFDAHIKELETVVERTTADLEAAHADSKELEEALSALEQQERDARALVASCTRAREAARVAHNDALTTEQSINAQIQAIEAIEQNRVESEGDARSWIGSNASELGINDEVLSHYIKSPKDLEGVVELLLGIDLDAFLVDNADQAKDVLKALEESETTGEITLLLEDDDARSTHGNASEFVRTHIDDSSVALIDAISYPGNISAAIEALLGDVVVCESVKAALKAHRESASDLRFVTRDGSVIVPSGKVSVGATPIDEEQGVLSRMRQMEELKAALVDAAKACESTEHEVGEADRSLAQAQTSSLRLSEKLAELRGNVQSAKNRTDSILNRMNVERAELEQATERRKEAEANVDAVKPDIEAMSKSIAEVEAKLQTSKNAQESAAEKLAPLSHVAESILAQLQEARINSAKATEKKAYEERMVARYAEDLERLVAVEAGSKDSLDLKRLASRRLEGIYNLLVEISNKANDRAIGLDAEVVNSRDSSSNLQAESEALRKRSGEAHAEFDDASAKLGDAKVERTRIEMLVERAVSEVVDGCSTSIETAENVEPIEDRNAVVSEKERLDRRIASLGTINPDAAREYEELKERYDYLQDQLSDLNQAEKSLSRINAMIETRMKDDFVATFELINKNFQDVFSLLFPGGTAYLSLEDPENLEDTGVEVNAQPAGKRISKMSLMSGGEKSLTALALLFALYRTRPTPFYILDEVEAALDDTNLRRLIGLIDAMRDDTQMIMITHQRRTMETADVLFGVSMGPDGVTKVVSQKLENALKEQS